MYHIFMRNVNVRRGMSKIVISQFLAIATALFAIVTIVVTYISDAVYTEADIYHTAIESSAILLIFIAICSFFGLIINIAGVRNAAKDEPKFNKAIMFIVIGIILSILRVVFVDTSYADYITISEYVMDYMAIHSVIMALSVALDSDPGSSGSVKGVSKVVKFCYVIIGICVFISGLVEMMQVPAIIGVAIHLILQLSRMTACIFYITQLRQAE